MIVLISTTDYPQLEDWLRDLDEHATRGQDQQNYLRWASFLMAEGVYSAWWFPNKFKSKELCQIRKGMNQGYSIETACLCKKGCWVPRQGRAGKLANALVNSNNITSGTYIICNPLVTDCFPDPMLLHVISNFSSTNILIHIITYIYPQWL